MQTLDDSQRFRENSQDDGILNGQKKRKAMSIRLLLSCVFVVSCSSVSAIAEGAIAERVLFVGNSYLYYNDSLHNHVERMAKERYANENAQNFEFKSATIGGAKLQHHNIDWLLVPKHIGAEAPFQVVIMQGASFEPLTQEDRSIFIETAKRYSDKVRAVGAQPMLYMTHAYVPPHPRIDKNMIGLVRDTYAEAGLAANADVVPVGLAYARSYKERPDFSLHADFDGTHPNLQGTYLGAFVVYLSLYGDDFEGLDYDYYGRLPKEETLYLQRIAEETVRAFKKVMGRE